MACNFNEKNNHNKIQDYSRNKHNPSTLSVQTSAMVQMILTTWSEAGLKMRSSRLIRSCLFRSLSSTSMPSTQVRPLHQSVYTFSDSFISTPDVTSLATPSSPASSKAKSVWYENEKLKMLIM